MELQQKIAILRKFDTKPLISKLSEYEGELETALREQAEFKSQHHQFLGSGDCQKVKQILAELSARAPETNEAGKKMTVSDKEIWLQKQRTENKELSEAIQKQRQVSFLMDDCEIKLEMARRRITSATALLALRTQQIAFLASG